MTDDQSKKHGRDAMRPREIPLRGWRDILFRVKDEISEDQLSIVAAGVAFYAMLALFPALIALVSIYGLVSDPVAVEQQVSSFYSVLPGDVARIVGSQLDGIVSSTSAGLSLSFAISVAVALWTASSGMLALITGVNIAYDEKDTRSYVRQRLLAIGFMFGAIVVVTVLVAGIVAVPIVVRAVGLGGGTLALVNYGRWPLLGLVFFGALSALYRYGPDRRNPQWRWVTWGAAAATGLWLLGSLGFSFYVSQFGKFNETYGTLGAVIVLLLWLYLSAFIVLLGAELNSEMEHQTARDSTVAPEKPMGERGAYVADTLGVQAPPAKLTPSKIRERLRRERPGGPPETRH